MVVDVSLLEQNTDITDNECKKLLDCFYLKIKKIVQSSKHSFLPDRTSL